MKIEKISVEYSISNKNSYTKSYYFVDNKLVFGNTVVEFEAIEDAVKAIKKSLSKIGLNVKAVRISKVRSRKVLKKIREVV